jgi:osmoprotectant transport system ATP-binding protein
MRAGKLVQYAPPGELLARPADDFVARFVGSDRGLKRLALLTVGGAELDPPVDPARLDGAPVLTPAMSLRDALAEMLASEKQVGMVRDGENYLGVLTLSHIGRLLRTDDRK